VASSPVIDLGDEDDSELVTGIIKYLYGHGRVHDRVRGQDYSLSLDELIDIYQLADKYDIPELRRNAEDTLYSVVFGDFQNLSSNPTDKNNFVDCIARVCGPDSLQFADSSMKTIVLEPCLENCTSLFQNKTFLQRYAKGELFDVESATAFGMEVGRLLASSDTDAEVADDLAKPNHNFKCVPREGRYVITVFPLDIFKTVSL
jgi:hypothetical protein